MANKPSGWHHTIKGVQPKRRFASDPMLPVGSVMFEVDWNELARVLGSAAAQNKSNRTRLAGGLIKVTFTPD